MLIGRVENFRSAGIGVGGILLIGMEVTVF
jgi:hypothetical protein